LNPALITLFALLLCADVTVLLSEKLAALSAGTAVGQEGEFYWQLAHRGWTWLAIGLGPVQLFIWSNILKRSELSFAYCVSSLCFPATMIAANILLNEHVDLTAWFGAILVTLGAALIGSSSTNVDRHREIRNDQALVANSPSRD
jgi:drug/metabolite transporter (DMT)-like permease